VAGSVFSAGGSDQDFFMAGQLQLAQTFMSFGASVAG
jgi:hypothetical protein